MSSIRLLIVDDHPIFRFGMHALISATPELEVAGEAGDVAEAVAGAERLRPDVVLMGIALPDGTGVEATRRIREIDPRMAILIVSMLDDDSLFAAMRAGARGYLRADRPRARCAAADRARADQQCERRAAGAQPPRLCATTSARSSASSRWPTAPR